MLSLFVHPSRLRQTDLPLLQFGRGPQGLRAATELWGAENLLRRGKADAGQAAVQAVLVGEIATDRLTVRAGKMRVEQSVGQRPAVDLSCRIEGAHEFPEVKGLDLVVEQRVAASGIELRHRLGDNLKGDHAAVVGCRVPVDEGEL